MPQNHETGFLCKFIGDTGEFSILNLLPAPHSVTAMPLATPPPFPHIFCLYFYYTNKMDLCPPGAGNICTATVLAPNARCCFCAALSRGLAGAGAGQPGAAGLLHEILRKLFAWRDKSCGSSRLCCRGDSATVATSPRNYIHRSFTMSCLPALAACGKSQGERRKRRDKHNASETR